ncbi:MAG: DNA internalization-related competence protein ComEC/Rec2 [Actinomycetota bacterium]|nr:DNA internalization-related competence protein ComEC/Rec2 [Actinomycetota bacterium]
MVLAIGVLAAPNRADSNLSAGGEPTGDHSEPPALAALPAGPGRLARAPPVLPAIAAAATFFLLGAGWTGLHEDRVRSSPLARLAPATVTVIGSLQDDPSAGRFGWSAIIGVSEVRVTGNGDGQADTVVPVHGSVWLEGSGSLPPARRGDRLRAEGKLERPGVGSFASFLASRSIAAVMQADRTVRLGPSSNPLVRAAQVVRGTLLREVRSLFGRREAGLLMGLALGDTSMLDPGDEEHFRATGLGHLLAVSGENVAMVLAPVLGLALLLRLSRWGRFLLGISTVLFFVVLTGGEPSVMRAGVMAWLALLGVLLGRPRSTATILGGAVLVLLVSDPTLVSSLGFQLSVAATAGMVALASPIAARMRLLPRPLAIAAATTLAAQAGVSPLLLYQFHQVPGVTLPANLLAFPAVAPALLLGLAAAAAALVVHPLGQLLAALASIPIRYLEGLADRLASAPIPSMTSGGGVAVLVVGLLVVLVLAWFLRSGRRLPRPALVAGAMVLPLFVWSTALRAGPPGGLVVHFFDVGEGDAALVTSPGGASVLIDGGPDPQQVATKLAALGVRRLDAVVATHPHLDHYMGLPAVLARFPVGLVLDTGCHPPESRTAWYEQFLRAVQQEGIREEHPRAGDVIRVGDLRLDILNPDRCWHGSNSDPNNDSIVILLSYLEDTVLFSNEPEAAAQQAMLDAHEPLTAEVLNVPHHGAGTSILPFFQAVHEQLAVVSVGPNTYGHPVPQTLDELRQSGARVMRTDHSGDVEVSFTEAGILVHAGRGRALLLQSAA